MSQIDKKIIIVGDSGCGKTSVMFRYVDDTFGNYFSTVGAGQRKKVVDVDGVPVTLNIWDTAGQEKYRSQIRIYCINAAAAVVMFDLSDNQTFEHVKEWISIVRDNTIENTPIFIVGNKLDLNQDANKFSAQIESLLEEYNLRGYLYCSAKTGDGINDLFTMIADAALNNDTEFNKGVNIVQTTEKKKCDC